MSIRVYKRRHRNSITWTASVTVRGVTLQRKPHTRGGFTTKEQAEQYARAKEKELLGRLEGIPKIREVRFEDFATEYLELCKKNNIQKHYTTKKSVICKSIIPFFEGMTLLNIQATEIEAYISKRKQEGLSQKTLLNEYTLLKHMLNQAVKWDYL